MNFTRASCHKVALIVAATAVGFWAFKGSVALAQATSDTSPIEANPTVFSGSTSYGPIAYSGTTPAVGSALPVGSLGAAIAAANAVSAPEAAAPPLGLTIVPSLGVQELYTTNSFGTSGSGQQDFISTITPGLMLTEQRPRIQATINYAPSAYVYARNSSEDYIGQQLNATANAALIPQALFLTLGGYATEQSTIGGLPSGGTVALPGNNRTSTYSFEASPSAVHRFGDIGTANLRFSLYHTEQSGNATFIAGSTTPFFVGTTLTTKQEHASFTTGPVLGRFNDVIAFNASQYTGNNQITDGARRTTYSDTLRFAVTRLGGAIGEIGREDIRYNGVPPIRIRDTTWSGGIYLTPAEHSSIIATYGHHDGFNSAFVQGSYPITERTQIVFGTSESLGTQAQQLQSNLAASTLNAAGAPVNSQTGAPVLLTNQLLGTQTSLFRFRQISAGTITTWSRDILNISFLDDRQFLVASSSGIAGYSQNSISGSISLSHALTPEATALAYFQYGRTTSVSGISSGYDTVYAGQLSVVYRLSPTLVANAQYFITRQVNVGGSGTDLVNSVGIGIEKIF